MNLCLTTLTKRHKRANLACNSTNTASKLYSDNGMHNALFSCGKSLHGLHIIVRLTANDDRSFKAQSIAWYFNFDIDLTRRTYKVFESVAAFI